MLPVMGEIEATIASLILGGAEGWNIHNLTPQVTLQTSSIHMAYTHLDITGPGILMHVRQHSSTTSCKYCIQLDGGPIYQIETGAYATIPLFMPFKSSARVTANTQPGTWVYADALLGDADSLTEHTWIASAPTTSHYSYTVLEVSGKGLLTVAAFSSNSKAIAIQADGGPIYRPGEISRGSMVFMIPFSTSLKITRNDSSTPVYFVYMLE